MQTVWVWKRVTIPKLLAILTLGLLLSVLAALGTRAQQGAQAVADIIYVDTDAAGANVGTSWDDAFTGLQGALDAAGSGDEIWVAEGTYLPTEEHGGSGDRYRSFQLLNGVALYGGFDPSAGDVAWEDRDWEHNVTIASGDIGVDGNPADNAYHVFFHPAGTDLNSSAILDGFTVTGGEADGGGDHNNGGGIYNQASSPLLANCTFFDNSASHGGGIYNWNASPTLANCSFSGNSANVNGGGMYNWNSSPALTNCTFSGNSVWMDGGGMYNGESSPVLTNCTFEDNYSDNNGGGMYNYHSSPALANCTFAGNATYYSGGAMGNSSSSPTLTNCTFFGNEAGSKGGAIWNLNPAPTLTNCILWGNGEGPIYGFSPTSYSNIEGGIYPGEGNMSADPLFADPDNGDFHLQAGSPCIDAGDNDAPNLPSHDFEGDDRIVDGDGDGTATVDMGVDEVSTEKIFLPLLLRSAQ